MCRHSITHKVDFECIVVMKRKRAPPGDAGDFLSLLEDPPHKSPSPSKCRVSSWAIGEWIAKALKLYGKTMKGK